MPQLTAAQHAQRAQGIGGSESAIALGLNPNVTPLDLYRHKVHGDPLPFNVPPFSLWLGHELEPVVATCFSHPEYGTGMPLEIVREQVVSETHPFIRGYIDRKVVGKAEGVELKAWSEYSRRLWGPTGGDEVPYSVLCQSVHYIIASGFDCWHVGVLLGSEFRHYAIIPEPNVIDMVIDGESEFWRRVQEKDPPPAMNLADIKYLYARSSGTAVVADEEAIGWHESLAEAKAETAILESRIAELEFNLKRKMQGAPRLLHPDDPDRVLVSWRTHQKRVANTHALRKDRLWPAYSEEIDVRPFIVNNP